MEEHIYTRSVDYNEDVYGSSYYKEDYYDEMIPLFKKHYDSNKILIDIQSAIL